MTFDRDRANRNKHLFLNLFFHLYTLLLPGKKYPSFINTNKKQAISIYLHFISYCEFTLAKEPFSVSSLI